ncbi:MAG: formate dehydrogenase accessory sulfurtransferase FdhD [Deltaproteobacteria bacterium]|nr:formate dehydrogenase accessory sulfurtransferase FdhD [Deltaproteobacteria bacterium]
MGDREDEEVTRRLARRWPDGASELDCVAVEEPLEIRVEGVPLAVVLRSPGHDLDLAAGFLFTEGVIDGPDDLVAIAHLSGDPARNTVDVRLAGGVTAHRDALARATRELYATSSCGVCGKASIDRLEVLATPRADWLAADPALLVGLPARLQALQPGFAATGGLHGAALVGFDGAIDLAREDVGRHNAVDKVLGARLRADRVPVGDRVLVVSSRAGFEVVQKAAVAGIPLVAALGAPTSLAIDLAQRMRVTLVGFLREDRYNVY